MSASGEAIGKLLSYSATDWEVTDADERQIVQLLRAERDVTATLMELEGAGALGHLVNRVDDPRNRVVLLQILGGRVVGMNARIRPHVARLHKDFLLIYDFCFELQQSGRKLGFSGPAANFDPAAFPGVVGPGPSDPFTGAGATGVPPTTLDIPLSDQALLLFGAEATTASYSNPIPGDLSAYLAGLTPYQRLAQARILLRRPIVTLAPVSYGKLPSRADVIRAAARVNNLGPELVAALVLAEQRDQSTREDAKDFRAAVSFKKANTSIGLGQVVITTASRHDLFADLLGNSTRRALTHRQIAAVLTSDELNIFAVARYARIVADAGARLVLATLPRTQAAFPAIDMGKFAANSRAWPDDNVRALGSEYTSKPWDDWLSEGWADFVLDAYRDVKAAAVF